MFKKLTILVAPMEGVGHVNACIGLAEELVRSGHKVVFVVDPSYEGKLVRYGFEEEFILKPKKPEEDPNKENKPGEQHGMQLFQSGLIGPKTSVEKMKILSNIDLFEKTVINMALNEPKLKQILDKHKPDLYIIDSFIGSPTLLYSGKPWVYVFSGNPLFVVDDERTPPCASGFPSNGDKTQWSEVRELSRNLFSSLGVQYNKWAQENGVPVHTDNKAIPDSPYLNIYGYPEELDYTDIRPIPEKWIRVDAFMRKGEEKFKLPEKLSKRDGKLIYLSLGSMGSIDVELMKRLVKILSKSKHQFIVSKGVFGDKYELADNMWGENSVPQTRVLPFVDLVITHGGNNTVTETFSFGKPMIVLPLFADQYDNAQRIHEKGFGIRLDPYLCSEDELLNGIESQLNDKELTERLSMASKRILSSNSLMKASKMIESLVK